MTAQYVFPDTKPLESEPDYKKLSSLEYVCKTCDVKLNGADTLKSHVSGTKHQKKLQESGVSENTGIEAKIAKYCALETPHREMRKEAMKAKNKERVAKLKEAQAGMTKEEIKAQEKVWREKRKKMIEDGTLPAPKKKKMAPVALTCAICQVEIRSQHEFDSHFWSNGHLRNVQQYCGGCWLCGVVPPCHDSHFEGARHTKTVARLEQFGITADQVGELGFNGAAPAKAANGGGGGGGGKQGGQVKQENPNAAKKTPGVQPGSGKGKGKANMMGMLDNICWNFVAGTCARGDQCKWTHISPY